MVAHTTAAIPFKGESFPSYVVNRTAGAIRTAPSSAIVVPSPQQLQAAQGPSAAIIVHQGAAFSSTVPSHVDTTKSMITKPTTISSPEKTSTKTPTRLQRPSLSDQLKAISHSAHSITTQLRSSYQLDAHPIQQHSGFGSPAVLAADCLLEATTIQLSIGRLDCRFPCPIQFAADRCSYLFQHPFESKEIQMIMYYRDMRQTQFSLHERSLRFRIDHPLEQFGDDYRPLNPQHVLKVVFATTSELQRVKQYLTRRMSSLATTNHNDQDQ